jgi:KDO2-lipid IV(A) lauroyltransferase
VLVRDLFLLSVITIMKLVGWVSLPGLAEFAARCIAFAADKLSRTKRRRAEENLSQAFEGEWDEHERRRIIHEAFYTFWRDAFWWLPHGGESARVKGVRILGTEHLESALRKGKGVILLGSNSFGGRALAQRILHQMGLSVHQVHSEDHLGGFANHGGSTTWLRGHIVRRFFEDCEKRLGAEILYLTTDSLSFGRVLLRRLKQNSIICISGDGKIGQKLIPLRFLGQVDVFPTGVFSLARLSGAAVLPLFCIPESDGTIRLIIESPVLTEENGAGSSEKVVARYVGLLESYIRKHPDKYWGWHVLGDLH